MSDDLWVHVNRERRHAVEPEVEGRRHVATGSFEIVLRNHGASGHVHVGLTGDLTAAASVETSNPLVDAESTVLVSVTVREVPRPIEGGITVTAGFGQSSVSIPVTVANEDRGGGTVGTPTVDAGRTGRFLPLVAAAEGILPAGLREPGSVVLASVTACALLVAALTALLVDSFVVLAGVLTVVMAVAFATGVLVRA